MPSSESNVIVTIEGSITPCVALKRGESRTVQLTPKIQRLIDRGFVVVTQRHEIASSKPAKRHAKPRSAPEPTPTPTDPTERVVEDIVQGLDESA